jgi:thiol-disulfide isomerase/thioredoxin
MPTVLAFFMEGCGPCQRFKPLFLKAQRKFAADTDIQWNVYDYDRDKVMVYKMGVESFPTIIISSDKGIATFEEKRTYSNFVKFIRENTD